MVGDGVPALLCKCKIKNGKIIFCAIHGAAEDLLTALEYARRFIGDCPLAVPQQEATKVQIVLPYLDSALAKARGKAE
jgi:hypothetical protein